MDSWVVFPFWPLLEGGGVSGHPGARNLRGETGSERPAGSAGLSESGGANSYSPMAASY